MIKKVLVLGVDGGIEQLQEGDTLSNTEFMDKPTFDPTSKEADAFDSVNHAFVDPAGKVVATNVSDAILEVASSSNTDGVTELLNESVASIGNQIWELTANYHKILVAGINKD